MPTQGTVIELEDRWFVLQGEAILDTQEGTLTVLFDDMTMRVFNWDKVINYQVLTHEELQEYIEGRQNGA